MIIIPIIESESAYTPQRYHHGHIIASLPDSITHSHVLYTECATLHHCDTNPALSIQIAYNSFMAVVRFALNLHFPQLSHYLRHLVSQLFGNS